MTKLNQNLKETYSTKIEQVDASVRFVLQDKPEFYESLRYLPSRVDACILAIVADWPSPTGYHFFVLRAAHRQYSRGVGYITGDEPPFTSDDLYG